jgi:hypothetical protein
MPSGSIKINGDHVAGAGDGSAGEHGVLNIQPGGSQPGVLGIVFCRADTDERYEDGLMGKNTMTHQRPQACKRVHRERKDHVLLNEHRRH